MTLKTLVLFASLFIFSCSSDAPDQNFRDVSEDQTQDLFSPDIGQSVDLKVSDTAVSDTAKDTRISDLSQDQDDADMHQPLPLTELQKYVQFDDGEFKYELVKKETVQNFQQYIFYVTSQKWRSAAQVDRPIWTHDVFMIIPPNMATNTAIVLIDGGSNKDSRPTEFTDLAKALKTMAVRTKSAIIVVRQNPNQKLKFSELDQSVKEDDLVAYTWRKLVEEKDPTWSAYFPMAKGVIKSMDAMQDYAQKSIANVSLDKFIITGFSKRGATTYMVASADDRVIAFAPGVFDVLNINEQLKHHFGAYGFWAPAVSPYVREGLASFIDTEEIKYLAKYVDPISYVDYLDKPKFLMMASGDQFFLPDASQKYYNDLKGDTVMRIYTNTGHSLGERVTDLVDDLTMWIEGVLNDLPSPEVVWERKGNDLSVSATPVPSAAFLWTATNENARDFRQGEVGKTWVRTKLKYKADGKYEIKLKDPVKGFKGHIIDFEFEDKTYSTPAFISPDTLPFTFKK